MTQHDRTWFDAMKHPAIWGASALLVGASILDIEGTDHCLRNHQCREGNPLMPKTVDRPRQYAAVLSADALEVYFLGRAKRRGRGNPQFCLVYTTAIFHLVFGVEGLGLSNHSTTATSTPARAR
jgi:hypothetical protein